MKLRIETWHEETKDIREKLMKKFLEKEFKVISLEEDGEFYWGVLEKESPSIEDLNFSNNKIDKDLLSIELLINDELVGGIHYMDNSYFEGIITDLEKLKNAFFKNKKFKDKKIYEILEKIEFNLKIIILIIVFKLFN